VGTTLQSISTGDQGLLHSKDAKYSKRWKATKSCFHSSSDHSQILITLTADALNQGKEPILDNRHIKCDDFRCLVNERLTLNIPHITEEDIEAAAKFFNDTIQCTG
jgi:hypothetical protein